MANGTRIVINVSRRDKETNSRKLRWLSDEGWQPTYRDKTPKLQNDARRHHYQTAFDDVELHC